MRKIYTIAISAFIFFYSFSSRAQEKIKEVPIKNVKGTAIGNDKESIGQVIQRAVNNAKLEALRKAGVEENIASYTDYFQSESNSTFEELFVSDILSDIRGSVKQVEVLDTIKDFDRFGQLNVLVEINCIVVKYLSNKDLSFDVSVKGVGMFYQNNAKLIFKAKSTKDAYTNIFIFNQTEAYQLFPSTYESSFLLKKDVEYDFPRDLVDYILYTNKKSEAHRMIVVFSKHEIPYIGEVEYKQIIDWIFSIPPDMRVIKSFGFAVVNESKKTE